MYLVSLAICFLILPRELPEGRYYAGSRVKDENALGGFGSSNNFPKKCVNGFPGEEGKLSLIVYPDEIIELDKSQAMPLRLVNRTNKTVGFLACDSRLYLVLEAFWQGGRWIALEKFPETFCGNSFHHVFLEANEYWEFCLPRHAGWNKTKLRFRLEPRGEQGGVLYSNVFEGNIEPGAIMRDDND
jgi:hypothetical protein